MTWRGYVWEKLRADAGLTAIVPVDSVFASGSMEEVPADKPFIVLRFDPATPAIKPAMIQDFSVWVHDDPGSYARIDQVLGIIRTMLPGPVPDDGGILIEWQGDSPELADDIRETIVRNASFRLAGRR
jgi:hypothetical protein